jgi:hypothetical protein
MTTEKTTEYYADLSVKLKTPGSFDTPWMVNALAKWDVKKEQEKADFTEHLYNCSPRSEANCPIRGVYTGLWEYFCVDEAGPIVREQYFEFLAAVKLYEEDQKYENH